MLLLGHSIARNYFPQVVKNLTGIANVYLMAVSTSVGDPRFPHQIASSQQWKRPFRVVHFNNGMHGSCYTKAHAKLHFPPFSAVCVSLTGKSGRLISANTTP